MAEMTQKGFFGTGTARENRFNNTGTLITSKDLKKRERGYMDFSFDASNEVLLVKWRDNDAITVATNHGTIEPQQQVRRHNYKERKHIEFAQPNVIALHNEKVRGVDLAEQFVTEFRCRIRSKKFWWPIFTQFLDVAIVNTWKLYRFLHPSEKGSKTSDFLKVKEEIFLFLLRPNKKTRNG